MGRKDYKKVLCLLHNVGSITKFLPHIYYIFYYIYNFIVPHVIKTKTMTACQKTKASFDEKVLFCTLSYFIKIKDIL